MGAPSSAGFTIIESVLFLAVTGLLIAGMIFGSSNSINIQRYRDAVETFKDDIQQQYEEISNVRNSRDSFQSCGATAKPVEDASGDVRGQSKCVIVGRYLRIDGPEISTYEVLASQTATAVTTTQSDIDIMKANYVYNASATPLQTKTMEWGTSIAWPTIPRGESIASTNPRQLGILFISSPYSGSQYTFTSNSIPASDSISNTTFSNMMQDGTTVPGRAARVVCIESDGLFVAANQSILITARASGGSSIEIRSNQLNAAEGLAEC